MESRGPARLSDLANQCLLRNQALAVAALDLLPTQLSVALFMEAISGRHRETLKAIVPAWPFPHLPLGALMKAEQQPCQDIWKAALDGLDLLLAPQIRPGRWPLQVLDLRPNAPIRFRNACSGTWDRSSELSLEEKEATEPKSKRRKLDDTSKEGKQLSAPVWVLLETLCLDKAAPDAVFSFLLKRVEQGKGLPRLCCRKLELVDGPVAQLREILKMVQTDCVEEVQVKGSWDLLALASFAPHLGQMVHLSQLHVSHILVSSFIPWATRRVDRLVSQFSCQLLSLQQLQELHLDSVFFLEGHLDLVLSCLQTHLLTLSITSCSLLESDLTYLSSHLDTSHLSHLKLRDVNMTGFSPELLHILLERASGTLRGLELDGCGITDYQLTSILPALGHCSQLNSFSLRGNPLSMEALESLLHHTIRQKGFRLGLLPVPLHCYVGLQGTLDLTSLRGSLAHLRLTLQDLGLPNSVLLFSHGASTYDEIVLYSVA